MKPVRCFVAIELEQRTALLLREVAAAIRADAPAWAGEKWVAFNNLHVTLKFLGDLPRAVLPALAADLAAVAANADKFAMTATGVAAQPSARRCGLLWVAFDDPEARYSALAKAMGLIAADHGVAQDTRTHRPHATLARARRPKPISQEALFAATRLLEHPSAAMSVSCASLLASTLTPSGPVYEPIAVLPLRSDING